MGNPRSAKASAVHALKFVTILAHKEVALYKIMEGIIKVKSMCLTITKELVLELELQMLHGVVAFLNNLLKIRGDHVGEPGEDDGIHLGLAWVVEEGIVRLNVVSEGISHQGQHHVVTPPGVVGRRGVQNNVHKGMDIRHRDRLGVKVDDNSVFV
jgi:hypothetical protein